MRPIRTILAVVAFSLAIAQAEQPDWKYLDPEAKALLGMNMTIPKKMGMTRGRQDPPAPGSEEAKAEAAKPADLKTVGRKYEFLDGADTFVMVSSPDQLGVATGTFPLDKVRESAKKWSLQEKKEGSAVFFLNKDKPGESAAWVDEKTVLLGEPEAMKKAIARSATATQPPALYTRGQKLAPTHMIWISTDKFDEEAKEMIPMPGEGGINPAKLEGVKAADIGMNMAKGISMKMDLRFETAAQAQKAYADLKPPKDMPSEIAKVTTRLDPKDKTRLYSDVSIDFEALFKGMGDAMKKAFEGDAPKKTTPKKSTTATKKKTA